MKHNAKEDKRKGCFSLRLLIRACIYSVIGSGTNPRFYIPSTALVAYISMSSAKGKNIDIDTNNEDHYTDEEEDESSEAVPAEQFTPEEEAVSPNALHPVVIITNPQTQGLNHRIQYPQSPSKQTIRLNSLFRSNRHLRPSPRLPT